MSTPAPLPRPDATILAEAAGNVRVDRRTLLRGSLAAGLLAGLPGSGCAPAAPAADLTRLRDWQSADMPTPRLFQRFPALRRQLPWLPVAELPTALRHLPALGAATGQPNLWIKDDSLSSGIYGGNKVRKLEFLIADALARGADTLVTMGAIGSHHCCATATFGRHYGLATELVHIEQAPSEHVLTMLRWHAAAGADFELAANEAHQLWRLWRRMAALRAAGRTPYFIWAGGSDAVGTLGFVEAAFELADQVVAGEMPVPEAIFVATGSGGSHAGLALGLALAGLPTRVIGVRVVPAVVANTWTVGYLRGRTARLLPEEARAGDGMLLEIEGGQLGGGYGVETEESLQVQDVALRTEGIYTETTYTAKALAGMLAWARAHPGHGPLLYWHTLNAAPPPQDLPAPSTLPPAYQRFFADTHSGTQGARLSTTSESLGSASSVRASAATRRSSSGTWAT